MANVSDSFKGGDQVLQPANPSSKAQASGKRLDLSKWCHAGKWVMNVCLLWGQGQSVDLAFVR
jgi:hypothetical protein